MECRTLSSRLTSKEGSSKVMVSGGSEVRYVSKGLMTLGHTPSGSDESNSSDEVHSTDSDLCEIDNEKLCVLFNTHLCTHVLKYIKERHR